MSKLFVQVERVEDLMGRVDNYFGGERAMTEYIKREDVHLAFDSYYFPGVLSLRETIDSVPSVNVVERKRGKWIDSKCSECGGLMPITKVLWHGEVMWETDYPMSRFCPNCGADMREDN